MALPYDVVPGQWSSVRILSMRSAYLVVRETRWLQQLTDDSFCVNPITNTLPWAETAF